MTLLSTYTLENKLKDDYQVPKIKNFFNIFKNLHFMCYTRDKHRKGAISMETTAKFDEITRASHLLNYLKVKSFPINVDEICESLGISINPSDFREIEATHQHKISGALITSKDSNDIFVNESDPPVRRRFTIAHELGHYFLHHKRDGENEITTVSFRGKSNREEREADLFAAELLMPESMVRERHSKMSLPLLWVLADNFNVSRIAMRKRLNALGLRYIEL